MKQKSEAGFEAADRENELVRQVASGSEAALHALYGTFGGLVYSVAHKILEDSHEAEEATQDVFVKAWRKAGAFDERRSSAKGWLCMMTRSTCLDRLRARSIRPDRIKSKTVDLTHIGALSDGSGISKFESTEALSQSLATLRREHRASIELAYFKGYTHREIAEALGVPEGTAKTFLRRGLIKLREVFASK